MILQIRAKNFMIYSEVELDFTDPTAKYLISAINHDSPGADSNMSGKTTIGHILTFGIFGKVPNKKFNKSDRLKKGTKTGYVEITLTVKGLTESLRIYRTIDNSELTFWIGEQKIEKGTPTLTQEALLTALGYSIKQRKTAYEDFLRTIKIDGKSIDDFAIGSPTENANFLGRIFGQEIWDSFVKVIRDDMTKTITPSILLWESKMSEDETVESLEGKIKELKGEISEAEDIIKKANEEQKELIVQRALIEREGEEQKTLKTLQDNLNTYKTSKQAELNGFKTRIKTAQTELTRLMQLIEKYKDEEYSEEELKEKESDISELEFDTDTIISEERDPLIIKFNEAAAAIENNKYYPIAIQKLYHKRLEESQHLNECNDLFSGDAETINKYISGETLQCPSCKTGLSLVDNKLKIFDSDSEFTITQKRLIKLGELAKQREEITIKLNNNHNAVKALRTEIKGMQEKQVNATKVTEYRTQTETQRTKIAEEDAQAKKVVVEAKVEIKKLELAVKEQAKKVKESDSTLLETIKSSLTIQNTIIEDTTQHIRAKTQTIGAHEQQREEIKRAIKKLEELYEERKRAEYFLYWAPIIKTRTIESKIPLLEEIANERLLQIQAKMGFLKLNMTKEKASGLANEFYPTLIQDGEETPVYKESSGGIRRIAFAILSAALELGAASKFGFFIVDEALDTFDPTGRMLMAKLINTIPLQGLITTHTEDIASMFECQLLVERKDNNSIVRCM